MILNACNLIPVCNIVIGYHRGNLRTTTKETVFLNNASSLYIPKYIRALENGSMSI